MKNKIIIFSLILVLIFQINVFAYDWSNVYLPDYSSLVDGKEYFIFPFNDANDYRLVVLDVSGDLGNWYLYYTWGTLVVKHTGNTNTNYVQYRLDGSTWSKFSSGVNCDFFRLGANYGGLWSNVNDLGSEFFYESTFDIYKDNTISEIFFSAKSSGLKGNLGNEWWLEIQPGQSIKVISDLNFYSNNSNVEVTTDLQENLNQLIGYEYLQKDGKVIYQDQLYINNFGIIKLYENEEIVLKNTSNAVMKVFIQWNSLDAASPDTELPTYEIIHGIPSNYYDNTVEYPVIPEHVTNYVIYYDPTVYKIYLVDFKDITDQSLYVSDDRYDAIKATDANNLHIDFYKYENNNWILEKEDYTGVNVWLPLVYGDVEEDSSIYVYASNLIIYRDSSLAEVWHDLPDTSNYYGTFFNCIEDEYYYLPIRGQNSNNYSNTFTIEYEPAELEVDDLSLLTYQKEKTAENIAGTGINIISYTPGRITFQVEKDIQINQIWNGLANTIKFKALKSGQSTVKLK